MQLSKIDASLSIINWDDYVTMAVLVDKTGRKKTANGNDFVIWRLCDLQDCQKVVSVFLFGSKCVEDFWKVMPGTVFALLNAVMWTNQQGQKQQNSGITLKIDNSQKILEIGLCPDFAYCQSQRQDGKRCTNVINKSVSSVCDFHILSQSKKFAAKRGEFQLNYSAPPKKFEPKAIPGLYTMAAPKITTSTSKTQSRKPNQASTLLSQVTSNRKANEVLNSVRSQIRSAITESSSESSTTLVIGKSDDIIKTTINESASDNAFVELLGTPSAGSRNLLKQIADQAAKKVANDLRPAIKGDKTLFTKKHCSSLKNAAHKTSQITCQQFLMSHFHKKPTTTMSNKNELAKAKAAAVLRRQSEPNFPLRKSHKFDSETNDIDLVIEGEPAVKKSKLGDLNMSTDDIKKLLLTKSRYDSELGQDDMARQESYFKILECKEKVENRAASIKELPIKVVNCSTCKYTWHSQSDLCKKLNHHLTRHEALRRFFKCKECSKRIICYEKYPNRPCANCSCKDFERTAMKEV
uniref:Protein MCM10 homolog n=1 Tax=Romanomermis culicivorax TaxID=13658 RepID=A0A915I9I8_ROMCU